MKKRTSLLLLLVLLLCFSACVSAPTVSETESSVPITESSEQESSEQTSSIPQEEEVMKYYKYVAVIGVDGAGNFFRQTDTPEIDRIFEHGAVTYDMLTSKPTISAQCWGSMLHGVTAAVHGLTNAIVEKTPFATDSKFPSFFRVIREHDADAVLASFCHWNPINVGIVEDGLDVYKEGGIADEVLTDHICSYLAKNKPTALFVQFDEVDGAGHSAGYGTQSHLNTITRIDKYIGRIYDAYEANGMLEDTLFIVTADHGGNGKSHGGWTDAEKYVMFAAAGKYVPEGTIGDMEVRDTAAVVLYALGIEQPETWTARVPDGLFEGISGQERPVYVDKESDRYHEPVPTPAKGTDGYVTEKIKNHTLLHYLTFDGGITDECGGTTAQKGKLYFVDGYFGEGVALDDGCISIADYAPGTQSFTASLWFKTEGVAADPVLFSNKNWLNGYNNGYVLSIRDSGDIRFNMGDGNNRMDANAVLPADYQTGWVHILLIVDREKHEIRMCYDFGEVITASIPENLRGDSLDAFSNLCIGQDGTGAYNVSLPATVDEFLLFEGAFDREDIDALAAYYGKSKD